MGYAFSTLGAFALGMLMAWFYPPFAAMIHRTVSGLVNIYGYAAPLVIYLVLAVALTKFFEHGYARGTRGGLRAVLFMLLARCFALAFGLVFCGVVFHLPFTMHDKTGFGALHLVAELFTRAAFLSPTVFAMVLAAGTAVLSRRWTLLAKGLDACVLGVEIFGQMLTWLTPVFLLSLGGYLAGFSGQWEAAKSMPVHDFRVMGCSLDATRPGGMIAIYLAGSLLTGFCCVLWHASLLTFCKMRVNSFSIAGYVRDYWIRLYPLLWATASESLSTPLNLHLVKKFYPQIPSGIRRFVVGVGSYFNVNGTMVCTVILTCLTAGLLGIPMSWTRLAMLLPVIFFVGFAVPGIPGELLLFAGPIAGALHLPEAVAGPFISLLLVLQFGLPDSFRTGNNSTDSLPLSLMLSPR